MKVSKTCRYIHFKYGFKIIYPNVASQWQICSRFAAITANDAVYIVCILDFEVLAKSSKGTY